MRPIFRFIKDHRLRATNTFIADLIAAMSRQTGHHDAIRCACQSNCRMIAKERKTFLRASAFIFLPMLAHTSYIKHPHFSPRQPIKEQARSRSSLGTGFAEQLRSVQSFRDTDLEMHDKTAS
jgi:hypothetical protein